MTNHAKELILKSLLIVAFTLLLMFFPGSAIVAFLGFNEKLLETIVTTILCSFFAVGILFMILVPVLGAIEPKVGKAEIMPLYFHSYVDFFASLEKTLKEKNYFRQEIRSAYNGEELTVYARKTRLWVLDCFVIVRITELSEEIVERVNDSITDILTEYYEGEITDTVDMISIFCVDRITPTFRTMINNNTLQGLKNGRLLVGISFGGKKLYIAPQKGGYAILKYKRLRKEFLSMLGIK